MTDMQLWLFLLASCLGYAAMGLVSGRRVGLRNPWVRRK